MKPVYVLFFVLVSLTTQAQNRQQPYVFPVKPGTPEWKFNSSEEMYNSCQVPKDILASLTTEALVITCLDFPLFGMMNAYNSPRQDLNQLSGSLMVYQNC